VPYGSILVGCLVEEGVASQHRYFSDQQTETCKMDNDDVTEGQDYQICGYFFSLL
jgi:hypothetical protein